MITALEKLAIKLLSWWEFKASAGTKDLTLAGFGLLAFSFGVYILLTEFKREPNNAAPIVCCCETDETRKGTNNDHSTKN